MNVSDASSASATAFAQNYAVAIAKKQQDTTQIQGQNATELIASAAPPKLQPGQTINVMA